MARKPSTQRKTKTAKHMMPEMHAEMNGKDENMPMKKKRRMAKGKGKRGGSRMA